LSLDAERKRLYLTWIEEYCCVLATSARWSLDQWVAEEELERLTSNFWNELAEREREREVEEERLRQEREERYVTGDVVMTDL